MVGEGHKLLTYIEYRAVSGVFRTIDPPPPLHLASVSSPRTKGRGVHTRQAVRGWGVNISEAARHWIGLLQYNPSTERGISGGGGGLGVHTSALALKGSTELYMDQACPLTTCQIHVHRIRLCVTALLRNLRSNCHDHGTLKKFMFQLDSLT